VAARLDAPVLGVQDNYTGPDRWQVSMSWRYQRSFRHFVGTDEQENRAADGSQVINKIHQAEVGIRYNANDVWSVAVGIPYLIAQRSSPIRDSAGVVVDRTITHSTGVGDITVTARRLLWHPRDHPDGNISLGLGVKLPTGQYSVTDTRTRLVNGQFVNTIETVDQSIQPGDGGFGAIVDLQAFQRIAHSGFALYGSATYLINPSNTNGVKTYRTGLGEEIMSVADQYLARAGGSYANAGWKGFGVSLGGRIEGVPVEDLVGGSDGFRRPGYAVSIEPAVSYSRGAHTFSLSVPFAVERNRQRSVPDRLVPGRHGDAAFADYLILLGYWRKF
jgi:Putative MetA-pathway of phenol degradation